MNESTTRESEIRGTAEPLVKESRQTSVDPVDDDGGGAAAARVPDRPSSFSIENDENIQTDPSSRADTVAKEEEEHIKHRRRYYLLIFAFVYTFFFSGAFFGWGPMQLLLEENGSYSSECTEEEQENEEICPSQSASLVRVHVASTVSQFIFPLLGELLDRYGPAFLSYLMGVCGCAGVALLVVAAQVSETDWLLFATFFLIANSTWMVRDVIDSHCRPAHLMNCVGMSSFCCSTVGCLVDGANGHGIPRAHASTCHLHMNSLFDAGLITYLGLWGLAEAFGRSLTTIASLYLVLAVFCFGGAAYSGPWQNRKVKRSCMTPARYWTKWMAQKQKRLQQAPLNMTTMRLTMRRKT